MNWTIESAAMRGSLAVQRISGMQRTLINQAADTASFRVALVDLVTAPALAYPDVVTIKLDGVGWFTGIVMDAPRQLSGPQYEYSVQLAGPWYYLAGTMFRQTWQADDGSGELKEMDAAHLFLGQDPFGVPYTIAQQLKEIIDYSADNGGVLQWGGCEIEQVMPVDEVRDIDCATAIQRVLRYSPDAVCWFDYTVSPPKFYCSDRKRLTPKVIDFASSKIIQYSAKPRYDLLVNSVLLTYEQTNEVDGISYHGLAERKAGTGTGRGFGTFSATFPLRGWRVNFLRAHLNCATLDINSVAWWKSKLPWLKDARVTAFTLSNPRLDAPLTYTYSGGTLAIPYELVSGQVLPWMMQGTDPVVYAAREATCQALVTYVDDQGNSNQRYETLGVKIRCTNAQGGDYASQADSESGDVIPEGLETTIYDARKVLHHDGSLEMGQIGTGIRPGQSITVTGAQGFTDPAEVQSVTERADTETTEVVFGPPKHLGEDDLLELSRFARNRFIITTPSIRTTGLDGGSSSASISGAGDKENGSSGAHVWQRQVLSGDTFVIELDAVSGSIVMRRKNAGIPTIRLSLANCYDTKGAPHDIQVRTVDVCETDSAGQAVVKKMMVIGSDVFES